MGVDIAADGGDIGKERQVEQFHGQQQGIVTVSGRFHLLNGDKILSQPFQLQLPQPEEGYPALVDTLGQGWQQAINP